MASKKIQLYTDRDKTIEASPETSANCVILSDGNDLQKVLDNDLTNPTVVHEETSFKVGVGDIDVSSSVVDGEVGRMVIKGKTYQNILPEPSTHVLTNNKEMFKVNEGLDPNVEIVDAVSKSAILSGQTLVNIRGKAVSTQANFIDYEVYGLQNNTTYTIVVESTDTNVISVVGFLKDTGNWNCQAAPRTQNCKVVLTTTSAELMGRVRVRKDNKQDTSQAIQIRVMVLKGDYSNVDIPHFEGITSCKMPVLTTTGKNLFNKELIVESWIDGDTGIDKNSGGCYVPIHVSGTIAISGYTPYNGQPTYIYEYDGNGKYIKRTSGSSEMILNLNENTELVKVGFYKGTVEHINSLNIQVEKGTQSTSYEPFKTNILSTPEEVALKGIGDVKDTLNCNTGEMVKRLTEFTLTGNENLLLSSWTNNLTNCIRVDLGNGTVGGTDNNLVICNQFKTEVANQQKDYEYVSTNSSGNVSFNILRGKLETEDVNGVKKYFKKLYDGGTPVMFIGKAKQEVIKTVDLSSSGNWEKIVLDGKSSENWQQNSHSGNFVQFEGYSNFCLYSTGLPLANRGLLCDSLDYYNYDAGFRHKEIEGISDGGGYRLIFVRIKTEKLPTNDVAGFKQWLSQNPIEVSYMLSSNRDSTQVKQPIFFKNGHVIQSSGADNSLIPTLDYQAKTSNSYVMDLMKTNTKYTMKAKSASGTFTIDGTSYGAGTNGTFTTPTSMTNKLLVMSNKTNTEVMILEGDVTDKTIPYFKGIKSAFEDEGKIEVLSTGKNLYPHGDSAFTPERDGWYFINGDRETLFGDKVHKDCGQGAWFYLEGGRYYFNVVGNDNVKTLQVVGEKERLYGSGATFPKGWYALRMRVQNANQEVSITNVVVEKDTETNYEPYKSNNTKIPLLSPLRSLPNGVCDELIIDRMKKKATLIKRLDCITFDGSSDENWHSWGINNGVTHLNSYHYVDGTNNTKNLKVKANPSWFTSRLGYGGGYTSNKTGASLNNSYFAFSIPKNLIGAGGGDTTTMCEKNARKWLSQNPVTVYYELATPVVTEIDLESFPLVYKDGHIFLNSEIAPVVEIAYNVNQAQQIQANNETLQRHELDILDLDNLIVSFVNAEYNLRLLKFDMELSMMALAE